MFVNTLREAGHVDGQNVVLDSRGIGDTPAQLPMLATQLVRRTGDVVVAIGAATVLAAKRAPATVPVVMLDAPNAVELGLVAGLARPGGSSVTGMWRREINLFAPKERVPVIASSRTFAAGGALMSYGPVHRLAATTVTKILLDKRPADVKVEQPTQYELVGNRATAKAIGVTIPPLVLARADEVIQ